LKALIVLAALAAGCGRGEDCADARDAAGKALAAAWPGLEERRANAEQALAAAIRHREDIQHWRLEWGDTLRAVQRDLGCADAVDALRCCDRMRAWFKAHRKPPVTTEVTRYFPALVISARQLRRFPGREEEAAAVVDAIESIQRLMADDAGGPALPDQVAAQCESAREQIDKLLSVADAVPGQPADIRAALDDRATAARLAHDWLVALASGVRAPVPKKLPPAVRDTSAAVARYNTACHD
jgi:hypothetical protein